VITLLAFAFCFLPATLSPRCPRKRATNATLGHYQISMLGLWLRERGCVCHGGAPLLGLQGT
jgi:hypothetical protein